MLYTKQYTWQKLTTDYKLSFLPSYQHSSNGKKIKIKNKSPRLKTIKQDNLQTNHFLYSINLPLFSHLALLLLVPSKELSNLIQDAGVLLFPAKPESCLSRGSRAHVGWFVGVWGSFRERDEGEREFCSRTKNKNRASCQLGARKRKSTSKRTRVDWVACESTSCLPFLRGFAHSEPLSVPAPLCSWMVCSSSDSEGRSLKVLSSRPGASREKRRTKWGRGSAGSAALAPLPSSSGASAPLESVTAGLLDGWPLFWFTSPRHAQKQQQGLSMGPALALAHSEGIRQ